MGSACSVIREYNSVYPHRDIHSHQIIVAKKTQNHSLYIDDKEIELLAEDIVLFLQSYFSELETLEYHIPNEILLPVKNKVITFLLDKLRVSNNIFKEKILINLVKSTFNHTNICIDTIQFFYKTNIGNITDKDMLNVKEVFIKIVISKVDRLFPLIVYKN